MATSYHQPRGYKVYTAVRSSSFEHDECDGDFCMSLHQTTFSLVDLVIRVGVPCTKQFTACSHAALFRFCESLTAMQAVHSALRLSVCSLNLCSHGCGDGINSLCQVVKSYEERSWRVL